LTKPHHHTPFTPSLDQTSYDTRNSASIAARETLHNVRNGVQFIQDDYIENSGHHNITNVCSKPIPQYQSFHPMLQFVISRSSIGEKYANKKEQQQERREKKKKIREKK